MPEMLEAEMARRVIEERALGRRIASVVADDAWYLKRGLTAETVADALPGRRFVTARRTGKQLLIDTGGIARSRTPGPVLGLHLGMSGRVVIDGESAGDPLLYASNAENPAWLRFGVEFADGGSLWMRDPRRLGAVELDPDESRFGPDAASIDRAALQPRCHGRAAMADAIVALTANQAMKHRARVEFRPEWFDPLTDDVPDRDMVERPV